MKSHPIRSSHGKIAALWVHTRDSLIDSRKEWEFDASKSRRVRIPKNPRERLPSPLETRLALQSRLIEAAAERKAWVEANRDKIIAAARVELHATLNN